MIYQQAAGLVRGRDHEATGKNCQDACFFAERNGAYVGVVCDGCGSQAQSEVGAKLGARIVAKALMMQAGRPEICIDRFRTDVTSSIAVVAKDAGWSLSEAVNEYFLFTVVAYLIEPHFARIVRIGDGYWRVTSSDLVEDACNDATPCYLGYWIVGSGLKVQPVIHNFNATDVKSIMVATDGVRFWGSIAEKEIPGRPEKVGSLSQFVEDEKYFRNVYAIERKLALMNRRHTKIDWANHRKTTTPGLLPDDVAIAVARRAPTCE